MIRMTSKLPSLVAAAVAASTLLAAPVSALESAGGNSASSVRDAVIAMSVADAALPAAVAATQAAPVAADAMAAMPVRAVRRARQIAYDRRIRLARSDLACSRIWCGHFPTLMLGIGF